MDFKERKDYTKKDIEQLRKEFNKSPIGIGYIPDEVLIQFDIAIKLNKYVKRT